MPPMKDLLTSFADQAELSDQLRARKNHVLLLAAGLYGESGSVLAELKKSQREGTAYPHYRQRLTEEFGDALWYFVRLASKCDPELLGALPRSVRSAASTDKSIASSLHFGAVVGDVLRGIQEGRAPGLRTSLQSFWTQFLVLAAEANVELEAAAAGNIGKVQSRW